MLAILVASSGCGQRGTQTKQSAAQSDQAAADDSGWWCDEHGVPEGECSMCSSKAAASFKAKRDWCKEHNRAESQCFICDPSRATKYAALYEAKVGKKPPTPRENMREP
jgi:hypothetical protein